MMIRRLLAAGFILFCATSASAAQVMKTERVTRELPIYIGGTLVVDNPIGDIDIVGTDDTKVVFAAEKNVHAVDQTALVEGLEQTQVVLGGDGTARLIKTLLPPVRIGWESGIRYIVRVPRTVHVNVTSGILSHIRISDMRATVSVKSMNRQVTLERVTGSANVETGNSNILLIAPDRGMADASLNTINGDVEVRVPAGTRFRWDASTIKGDLHSNFAVNGAFIGPRFRAAVNGDGGPLISTQSFNGTVLLLQNGAPLSQIKAIRAAPQANPQIAVGRQLIEKQVTAAFRYATNLGDVIIGEIRGDADVTTGAGLVQLGSVLGDCRVVSKGGPLSFGQIAGVLTARTEAGDVMVQSAAKGGTIVTGGGTIRVSYTGGDTTLHSGGGDIVVKRAEGPIKAETQSGDITIVMNGGVKSEKLSAKTAKGNVDLHVPPTFAADIDATVITSDPDANNIASDFANLQVRREEIGGKTKIRATGKVNGGGDRVELYAEDGGIQISTHAGPPSP